MQSHDAVEKKIESPELRGSQTCCGFMWSHEWNSVLADPNSWATCQAQLKVCWISGAIRWLLDRPSSFCPFKQQMSGGCYSDLWPLLPFKPPSPNLPLEAFWVILSCFCCDSRDCLLSWEESSGISAFRLGTWTGGEENRVINTKTSHLGLHSGNRPSKYLKINVHVANINLGGTLKRHKSKLNKLNAH